MHFVSRSCSLSRIRSLSIAFFDAEYRIRPPKQCSLLPCVIAMHFVSEASKHAKLNEVEPHLPLCVGPETIEELRAEIEAIEKWDSR